MQAGLLRSGESQSIPHLCVSLMRWLDCRNESDGRVGEGVILLKDVLYKTSFVLVLKAPVKM